MPFGLVLKTVMNRWAETSTRDQDGMFEHHMFCAWSLIPCKYEKHLLALVEDLLIWPNQPSDLFDAQYERISQGYSHGLGMCEETRLLFVKHVKGMIEHRPVTPDVIEFRPYLHGVAQYPHSVWSSPCML
jgi:hypothetical protein